MSKTLNERVSLGVTADELASELAARLQDIEGLVDDADASIAGLSDEAFRWRPEPGRWSVSECLQHLNTTFDVYLPAIDKCIAGGRERGKLGDGPARRGRFNGWFIRSLGPPATKKFKAPKKFAPEAPRSKDEVYPAWLERKQHMAKLLAEANGLDLWRNRLRSPALPILRFSLGETFALLTIHEARHLWQAGQVIAEPEFPG